MSTLNSYVRKILVLFLVFGLCFALPASALADEQPPPAEEVVAESSVEENSDPPQVTEEAEEVREDESQVEESASSSAGEVDSVSEILGLAPSNTEIIVLDENGEPLPLVTQEASDAIAAADPIWCPAGVAVPVASSLGCSPSFTSMTGLIAWLQANDPNQAGTIWIEGIYDSSTAVGDGLATSFTFNGSAGNLDNMAKFALTIKGGWNGMTTGTVDTGNPSRFEGDSFSIINWKGNITISDLEIFNATVNPNCGAALCVSTEGNITLIRVNASLNDGVLGGAILANNAVGKSSTVTITNSNFDINNDTGLLVNSHGAVNIKDSTFFFNDVGSGATINNYFDVTPSPVTIISSTANLNGNGAGDNGLTINSNGVVTLTNVTANTNFGSGARINTTYNAAGNANVVLTNTNYFEGNDEYGLYVITNGSITIKQVMANANGLDNAYLNNNNFNLNLLLKPVTISGTGIFNGSLGGDGLRVISNGAVTLSNITAGNNFGYGAFINNNVPVVNNSPVTLKGTNTFNNNDNDGLQISSDGNISISNVTANDNALRGVDLSNNTPPAGKTPSVTVLGFLTAIKNDSSGLYILSDGAISLTNLTINGNLFMGATIDNSGAPTPQPVKITGTNVFNNSNNRGLEIISKGAVTLNNISANGNGVSADVSGVHINNKIDAAIQQNVTITGFNTFNNNGLHGLFIQSYGTVSISNITANDNGKYVVDSIGGGVRIDNIGGTVTNKGVTLSGYGIFNNNDADGFGVFSNGVVITNNLTASGNGLTGTFIANDSGAVSAININGVNFFTGNIGTGLFLNSDGAITISKTTAHENAIGVQAVNFPSSQPITVSGFISANENTNFGIQLVSAGVVSVANATAIDNDAMGMYISNDGATTPKAVTLSGNNFFGDNTSTGLFIFSSGAVTTNNVTALNNGLSLGIGLIGVIIQNNITPASQQPVTMNGFNIFNGNGNHGLNINSYGAITLNNVTAIGNGHFLNNNAGDGLRISNTAGATVKPVTIKGTNTFNQNDGTGLTVLSEGVITLSNVTAYRNDTIGLVLDNNSTVQAGITITGYASVNYNNFSGLVIESNGSFNGTNVSANNNGQFGATVNIIGITSPQSFTLKGNNTFNSNSFTGLFVLTDGNITVSNLNANNNTFYGAFLDNFTNWNAGSFTQFGSVTQTGFGNFNNNNTGSGLYITTNGSVTLTRITANYNGTAINDDGIHIEANGNVTLACAVTIGNFEDGLQVIIGGNFTLKGLLTSFNGDNEDFLVGGTTTITTCP
ncbi:MAG: hypothetical protein KF758_01105 [Anaerolineales bacterium]|nr:hypothetical protein [Anaerolineales bacterium]